MEEKVSENEISLPCVFVGILWYLWCLLVRHEQIKLLLFLSFFLLASSINYDVSKIFLRKSYFY